MALDPVPATASSKTRYVVTLLSGTSWTVPAGCLYINATLRAGGGSVNAGSVAAGGNTTMTGATTASGGAVATGAAGQGAGNQGFAAPSGATNAAWPNPGQVVSSSFATTPGASISYAIGAGAAGNMSTGGQGSIEIEYWA